MARRGDQLREHILWTAKDVFLEVGFERASMDVVASRAGASKRSLYAHFESKEKLFLAVIEFVRGLFLTRLRRPQDYSEQSVEAVTIFCERYLESMLYAPSVRMCRISMAESERFPEQAMQYFDVLFTEVQARLAAYLTTALGLPPRSSGEAAQMLLGQVLFPQFPRVLFGVEAAREQMDEDGLSSTIQTGALRKLVREFLEPLMQTEKRTE